MPALSTKTMSIADVKFEVVRITTFGHDLSLSNCVYRALTTLMESDGSEPDNVACLAAARLSTSLIKTKSK